MTATAEHGESHGGMRLMYIVWVWLIVLTVAEVLLAYFQVPLTVMLLLLIGMSLIKSVLIMAYFMHLRFDRASLTWTLIPAMVICILLMCIFFPDSVRLGSIGLFD